MLSPPDLLGQPYRRDARANKACAAEGAIDRPRGRAHLAGMYDAVLFDCDGVLVDTEMLALDVEGATLAEFGVVTERSAYSARFMGLDDRGWLAALMEDYPVMSEPGNIEKFRKLAKERYYAIVESDRLAAIADVHDAVAAFAGRKAVASSSSAKMLDIKLQRTGLWPHFDPHVYSTELVAKAKPAPDIFLHAAAALDVDPARCLVIEDSRNGVFAGRAAGMDVWGFIGGGHCTPQSADVLTAAGAARVIGSWREAAALFASWR